MFLGEKNLHPPAPCLRIARHGATEARLQRLWQGMSGGDLEDIQRLGQQTLEL